MKPNCTTTMILFNGTTRRGSITNSVININRLKINLNDKAKQWWYKTMLLSSFGNRNLPIDNTNHRNHQDPSKSRQQQYYHNNNNNNNQEKCFATNLDNESNDFLIEDYNVDGDANDPIKMIEDEEQRQQQQGYYSQRQDSKQKLVWKFSTTKNDSIDSKKAKTTTKGEPESESSSKMRDEAYEICRKYLSGEWRNISSDDMIFKSISGGLSNNLFYCSLPSTHTPVTGEPSQVLLRMYGQLLDRNDTKITDSVITMLLSERNLGPKLYGIFPGGRLEEYIPARAMVCNELKDPNLSGIIARKLALVHQLNVPINKEPTWLSDSMYKWLKIVRNYRQENGNDDNNNNNNNADSNNEAESESDTSTSAYSSISSLEKELISFDFEMEISKLFSILSTVRSPVVFCHNDLQEGNILLPSHLINDEDDMMKRFLPKANQNNSSQNNQNTDENNDAKKIDTSIINDDHIVFIDFEYCSYNYRGFDIGNHFCEWMFDYSNDGWPHFFANYDDFPSIDQKKHFVNEYLKQSKEMGQIDPQLDTEENLIKEADFYTLASHLLWTLWSIINSRTSKIPFGYLEYGKSRLEAYQRHMKYLKQTYSLDI